MSYLTSEQAKVYAKIIAHVESNGNYGAFAEAGANTSNEKAITIGCFQFYATEAQELLKYIQTKYPTQFAKLDTASIADDLVNCNWATYAVTKTSAKGKCIISIISSSVGIDAQDALFTEKVESQMKTIVSYGVTDPQAMCMAHNFLWQGGASAAKRVIAKTSKPYTLNNLYAAVCTDTGTNQVGTYKSRQKYVYEHLKSDWPSTSSSTSGSTNESATNTTTSINKTVKWTGYMTETYKPRTWAGASTTLTKVSSIAKNESIGVCDTIKASDGTSWYYVKIQNKYYGFVPASKVSKTKVSTTSLTPTSTSKFVKSGTSSPNKTVVFNGKVKAGTGSLYVRKWAGKENATLTSIPYIKEGTEVEVCDAILAKDGNPWYYVRINKKTYGFCGAAYIVAA